MPIPIRCFTCGKVIANKYDKYLQRISDGEDSEVIFSDMKFTRMCCRRMFLSHSDELDKNLELYGKQG